MARDAIAFVAESDFLPVHAEALMDFAEVLRLLGRSAEAAPHLEESAHLSERKGDVVSAARAGALLEEIRRS